MRAAYSQDRRRRTLIPTATGGRRTAGGASSLPIACSAFVALLLVSLLFIALPEWDMAASRLFHVPGEGFVAAKSPLLKAAREAQGLLTLTLCSVAGSSVVLALGGRRPSWLFRPQEGLFVLAANAIGPGLLVNAVLKAFVGRARPRDIEAFGGDLAFTPAWILSDACRGNCSFVAGEGAAAAALLSLLFVLPERARRLAASPLIAFAAFVSVNRIAFGGHFLSDVVLSWLMVLIVMAVLRGLLLGNRGDAIDRAVGRLATAARRRLGRLRERVGAVAARGTREKPLGISRI